MVISIKNIFICLASISLSTGAIFFLDASFPIKITLLLIFIVVNIIATSDLLKINNLKETVVKDTKKKLHVYDEVLGGIIGIVWFLQMPRNISIIESALWIFTNAICLLSTLYVIYKITNSILNLGRKKL